MFSLQEEFSPASVFFFVLFLAGCESPLSFSFKYKTKSEKTGNTERKEDEEEVEEKRSIEERFLGEERV